MTLDRASRWLAADRAMLFVAEAGGTRLVPRAAHGFRREDLGSTSVRSGEGIIGRVFKERRVLAHPVAGGGPSDAFIERFPVCEAIAVPVRGEEDVAGVLYVGRRRLDAPFSASDILLLLVIADRVGRGLVRQAMLDRQAKQIARLAELGRLAGRLLTACSLGDVLAAVCEVGRRIAECRPPPSRSRWAPARLERGGLARSADTRGREGPGQYARRGDGRVVRRGRIRGLSRRGGTTPRRAEFSRHRRISGLPAAAAPARERCGGRGPLPR